MAQFSRRLAPYLARWDQRRNRAARQPRFVLDLEGRRALRCVVLPGPKKAAVARPGSPDPELDDLE